ncbi:MAG: hypothetical protein RBT15_03100 [Gudongella sp.]|nr:hypothetical protein [Gudongella sp.]
MKKKVYIFLILALVLMLAVTGCKKKEEPQGEPQSPPVEQPVEEAEEEEKISIMESFAEILDSGATSEIAKFVEENIPKMGQLEASSMIDGLEKALTEGIGPLRDEINNMEGIDKLRDLMGNDRFLSGENIAKIEDENLKKKVEEAVKSHYKLMADGMQVEPVVDYRSLLKYESKLTEEWKEYLDLMATDSDSPPFAEDTFLISFEDLGKRIINVESYMNRYISGPRQEILLESYESKLTAFMKGLPNTPIAAYDDNILLENVYRAYESFSANEGFVSTGFVHDYMIALRDNGMKVDNRMLAKADQYIEEAVRVMREFK